MFRRLQSALPLSVILAFTVLFSVIRSVGSVQAGISAYWLNGIFQDDAYYYLGIARAFVDTGQFSFGGIVQTNGFHPLWQLTVVGMYALSTRVGVPVEHILMVSQLFLLVATSAFMYWLGIRLGSSRIAASFSYILVFVFVLGLGGWLLSGMENALLLPLATWYIGVASQDRSREARSSLEVLLGVLGALVVLARLDAAFLVVAVESFRLWSERRSFCAYVRGFLIRGTIMFVPLAAYVGWNRLEFGSFLPISGLAKSLGSQSALSDTILQFLSFGSLSGVPLNLGLLCTVGAVGIAALGVHASRTGLGTGQEPPARLGTTAPSTVGEKRSLWPLARCIYVLFLAQVLQLLYFGLTSSWQWWPWYFYYIPLLAFLLMCFFFTVLADILSRGRRTVFSAASFAVLLLLYGGVLGIVAQNKLPVTGVREQTLNAVSWVRRATTPSSVIAIGDRAGFVGWAVDRRVVQMEGLVEDRAFVDDIQKGSLEDALRRRHVGYVTVIGKQPEPGCNVFLEPAQGQGPKSRVLLCGEDIVFSQRAEVDTWITVWRFPDDRDSTLRPQ